MLFQRHLLTISGIEDEKVVGKRTTEEPSTEAPIQDNKPHSRQYDPQYVIKKTRAFMCT